jgi:hypothetical protein
MGGFILGEKQRLFRSCNIGDQAKMSSRSDEKKLLIRVVLFCLVIAFGIVFAFVANAQEHHHPPQDQEIHERFYSTWMMPDNRNVSCCHNEDCSPAESRFENGHWLARKSGEEDSDFTEIPDAKIERERDSPDGRSHVCGRRHWMNGKMMSVFCFIPGISG